MIKTPIQSNPQHETVLEAALTGVLALVVAPVVVYLLMLLATLKEVS